MKKHGEKTNPFVVLVLVTVAFAVAAVTAWFPQRADAHFTVLCHRHHCVIVVVIPNINPVETKGQ